MAELLLRVVDKTNPTDPVADRLLHKAGDVITVQADGWGWTRTERTHPEWRIVKLPGVDPSTLAEMLAPLLDATGAINRRRARGFNVNALASLLRGRDQVLTVSGPARAALLNSRVTRNPHGPIVIG